MKCHLNFDRDSDDTFYITRVHWDRLICDILSNYTDLTNLSLCDPDFACEMLYIALVEKIVVSSTNKIWFYFMKNSLELRRLLVKWLSWKC